MWQKDGCFHTTLFSMDLREKETFLKIFRMVLACSTVYSTVNDAAWVAMTSFLLIKLMVINVNILFK